MADVPAPQPSQLYQPLQRNQCSGDAIYAKLVKPEQAGRENELKYYQMIVTCLNKTEKIIRKRKRAK